MSKNRERKMRRYAPALYYEMLRSLPEHKFYKATLQNLQSGKCASLDDYLGYLKNLGEIKKLEMARKIIAKVKFELSNAKVKI
jgi:hypothetical protein